MSLTTERLGTILVPTAQDTTVTEDTTAADITEDRERMSTPTPAAVMPSQTGPPVMRAAHEAVPRRGRTDPAQPVAREEAQLHGAAGLDRSMAPTVAQAHGAAGAASNAEAVVVGGADLA